MINLFIARNTNEPFRQSSQRIGRFLRLIWLLTLLPAATWGLAHAHQPTTQPPVLTTVPLLEVPAHAAGQPITITWSDVDMGAPPTITLYFDSLSRHDYELIYTINWNEPISFTIPQLEHVQCHATSLPAYCTPFYGGWLYMAYEGQPDGLTWEIDFTPNPAPPNTVGCESLFPIQPEQNVLSLSADNFPTGSTSTYPQAGDFPTYGQFPHNTPDVPLWAAEPGYIYQLQQVSGNSWGTNFVTWNQNPPSSHFSYSLAWPSRSHDYQPYSGGRVHGFIELTNHTDREPHVNDQLLIQTGVFNSTDVQNALTTHIDLQRLLRMPLGQTNLTGGTGQNQWTTITGFAIFRLHGYEPGQGGNWFLAEFVRWEDGCGQLSAGVTLTNGDTQTVLVGETAVYTHTLTNTGSISDTFSLTAESAHPWDITITPTNTQALVWNESIPVTVTVTVPMGVLSGTVNLVTITAVSHADPAISHTVTNTTTSQAIIGVALSPHNEALATPTETITYTHILLNAGSEADQFSLTAVSSQEWAVTIVPTETAALASGASIPITVTISVPAGVLSGTLDLMTVTAVSHADPAISRTVTNTTTTTAVVALSLTPDNSGTGQAGEWITYTHTLQNWGSQADQFSVEISSTLGWEVVFGPTITVMLAPQEAITLTVAVHIPQDALAEQVEQTMLVATSHLNGQVTATAINQTTVLAPPPPAPTYTIYLPFIGR